MGGEVRQVQVLFLKKYDFEDRLYPILKDCIRHGAKTTIVEIPSGRLVSIPTMGQASRIVARLIVLVERKPRDLGMFFETLEARFKSSTTVNLTAIPNFKPLPQETPERMFARYNMLCKPSEDFKPCIMTKDQLKTTFTYNLHFLLTTYEL